MVDKNYINNMSFPSDDVYWADVWRIIEGYTASYKILAPCEYCALTTSAEPYPFSFWRSLDEYGFLVLHKGMKELLSERLLANVFNDWDCIYANAVFLVYCSPEVKCEVDSVSINLHFSILDFVRKLKSKIQSSTDSFKKGAGSKYLLVSANGYGNLGDDAITIASRDLLLSCDPSAEVIIDSPPLNRDLIGSADYLVLAGGGIFYDSCFYNAQNYCNYILIADELGVKSFCLGIGTQGIKSVLGFELYKNALDKCEFISVRDSRDYEVLVKEIGVSTVVNLSQDVVFSIDKKRQYHIANRCDAKPLLLYSLLDSSKLLAANVMQGYQDAALECIGYLVESFDVKLVVQSRDDLGAYDKILKKFNLDVISFDINDVYQVQSLYEEADIVLTSRFHGFIFSLKAGASIISVGSRGGKIHRLISHNIPSARSGFIPLRNFSMAALKEKVSLYFECKDYLKADTKEVSESIDSSKSVVELLKKHIS